MNLKLIRDYLSVFIIIVFVTSCKNQSKLSEGVQGELAEWMIDKKVGVPEPFSFDDIKRVLNSENFLSEEINLIRMTGVDEDQSFRSNTQIAFPNVKNESVKNHPFGYYFANGIQSMQLNAITYESRQHFAILTANSEFYNAQINAWDKELGDLRAERFLGDKTWSEASYNYLVYTPFLPRIFYNSTGYADGGAGGLSRWDLERFYHKNGITILAIRYTLTESFQSEVGQEYFYGFISTKSNI